MCSSDLAYDPVAGTAAAGLFTGNERVVIVESAQAALEGAEALAIVTEWQEFRSPDFDAIKRALRTPAIFDGRNLYEPATMRTMGIEYFAVGRRT